MGRPEIDKLLLALSKTKGLQRDEEDILQEELYNVKYRYLPDRIKY